MDSFHHRLGFTSPPDFVTSVGQTIRQCDPTLDPFGVIKLESADDLASRRIWQGWPDLRELVEDIGQQSDCVVASAGLVNTLAAATAVSSYTHIVPERHDDTDSRGLQGRCMQHHQHTWRFGWLVQRPPRLESLRTAHHRTLPGDRRSSSKQGAPFRLETL
jgi:hypothetical protein